MILSAMVIALQFLMNTHKLGDVRNPELSLARIQHEINNMSLMKARGQRSWTLSCYHVTVDFGGSFETLARPALRPPCPRGAARLEPRLYPKNK